MAPAFRKSSEYTDYLGETVLSRPQDQLLPRLDSQDGQIYMAPGELYCRFRHPNGQLCSNDKRFSRRYYLVWHYQVEHNLTIAHNATKPNSKRGRDLIVAWYKELMEGQQPSWRAKDQQSLQANTQTNAPLPVPSAQNGQAQPTQDDQPQAADEDLPRD
ncbi:hypothetical protein NCS57_01230200 [Fusarium keratoplasticum]|uniref:Uncharacterized protein n=1 Tax=Fusarium keratoplasticum TaxID=1328300 RepID=A0ACC0QH33_9HYPO|nr:hypothetical protein NCS57_01230200 [Fusarium keratoplasticum]KAI8654831.1 hypothetical protein NCS57_01230200 [Fusarium keratoplasticum]